MMLVLLRKENQSTQRKNPWNKEKNQPQTQPTYDAKSRNQTWATLVGGKCSNHYAIPSPYKSYQIILNFLAVSFTIKDNFNIFLLIILIKFDSVLVPFYHDGSPR